MKNGLTLLIVILMLNCLMTGCGNDEVMEEDVTDSLLEKMERRRLWTSTAFY